MYLFLYVYIYFLLVMIWYLQNIFQTERRLSLANDGDSKDTRPGSGPSQTN